jgi:polyisoprenoid-binding protein YceI
MVAGRALTSLIILAALATTAGAQAKSTASARKAAAPAPLRYVVAPTGNEARYRVREQLVGVDLPNDAVGVSRDITGLLVVEPNGTVVGDSSRIVVNISNIKSDKDRRDGFVKRRTLETDKFPTVELAPRTFRGLASKPPAAGSSFDLVGDLTVHGVTHPTTWKVTARSDGADVVGTATTAFTFKDFALDQPKVPVVLSVADTIKLEYDFRFTPAGPKAP